MITHTQIDQITTMLSTTADIQRLLMQVALNGGHMSNDRANDLQRGAQLIIDRAKAYQNTPTNEAG